MFNFKINRMNKKFLSTLLMGALFIASVSVFTSCKDYDEDIQNLQGQVDGLKSDLNSQIATLKAAQEKCASDCAAAQAALDQAIKNLESTKANKADVDKAIQDAIAGAKADNDALKTELQKYAADYADAAAAKAAAAAKEEAIKEAVAQAKALVDALDAKKVDLVEFTAKVQELQNSIKAVDDALAAYKEEQTAAWAANDEALKEINLQIDALKKFNEQVQKDFEGVNTNIENLQKDLEQVKKDLEAQKKDLEKQISDAKAELQKQIEDVKKALDESETIAGLTKRIVALEEKAENNRVEITKIQDWMTEADKKFNKALAGAEKANVLDLYIQKVLTSIYLKPEFFYSGIEAIELPALYDNQYTEKDPLVVVRDEDGKVTKMEVWTKRTDLAMVDVCNGGVAYYHLNPWNADIEGATVAFLSNEAKTRAGANYGVNDLIKPVKETLEKDSRDDTFAGVLPVEFTGSFEAVNSLLKAGVLPQVALNYKQTVDGKDVNVSSDWALLAPTQYCKLLIADKTGVYDAVEHKGFNFDQAVETEIETLGKIQFKENGQEESRVNPTTGHFTRLLENITADSIPGTFRLRYDSVFCLNDFVETHYSYSYRNAAGVEVTNADQKMDTTMFKKFGLHYEFDIVAYKSGNNNTEEDKHMWIVKPEKADGKYIAYFTKVKEDGSRAEATGGDFAYEQAGRASVGRMPVVRVLIKDATGKVVAYSYIKLEITEDFPSDPEPETVDFKFEDPFYVDCDTAGYKGILSWSQIERKILIDALDDNYSKNSFEAKWELVGYNAYIVDVLNGAEGEATQFDETGKKLEKNIGKVQLVEDPKGQHMQVLQWAFTHADIENLFYDRDEQGNVIGLKNVDANGESTIDFTVYVKLEGPKTIWVKFYIPKGTFKFATGSINDNKTDAMWKGLNTRAEGFKEVYANVVAPNTKSDNVKDFVLDMLDTFDEHKVGANFSDEFKKNFPKFAEIAANNYEFTFTTPTTASPIANAEFNADKDGQWTVNGNSGAVYTLKVSADTKAVLVAAIKEAPKGANVGDTIVAIENVNDIVYKRNISAYDVLNYAGHNEVKSKQTFTAYLKISVAGCYPLIINDGSDYFNVKFLRPIDVEKTKDAVMEDAVDGGSKVNIMDLVSLIDWRDQSFTSPNGLTDKDGDQPDVQYKKYDTPHYINYYGVKIFADVDAALTDITKPEAERQNILPADQINETNLVNLKKNSPNAIFTFTPAKDDKITWDGKKFVGGELYYSNNNMNVKLFHIYVPIMLEYTWSEGLPIYCGYGVVTVKKTINNDAKKF